MSSSSRHQQHLTSADMDMIARVHDRICARNAMASGGSDAQDLAALLVRQFQLGVSSEHDLMAAFGADGLFTVIVPTSRLHEMAGRLRSKQEGRDRQDAALSNRRRFGAAA